VVGRAVRHDLDQRFLAEIAVGKSRILERRHAWQPLSDRVRRYRLNRFPYGIIYAVVEDEVVVIAIAHLHREPGYWRARLQDLGR